MASKPPVTQDMLTHFSLTEAFVIQERNCVLITISGFIEAKHINIFCAFLYMTAILMASFLCGKSLSCSWIILAYVASLR